MIVVRIKGGLGNQMFQYSLGYSLAKRLNQPLFFCPAFTSNMRNQKFMLNDFNVDFVKIIDSNNLSFGLNILMNKYVNKAIRVCFRNRKFFTLGMYCLETEETYIPEIVNKEIENICLDGYFQTPLYFEHYRNELIHQFIPRYVPNFLYSECLDEIINCNSVAIHVRRGDFKNDRNTFHYLLDESYYKVAIDYIRKRVIKPIFYWFSDDMNWVKDTFGESSDYQFIQLNTPHADIDEMMLMKNCKHIIAANSTFSWWAAWLNENDTSIIVVPKKAYGNSCMIPSEWIKI